MTSLGQTYEKLMKFIRFFVNRAPALCGSRPLVTPYYCRLGDLLCFMYVYRYSSLLLSMHICFVLFPLFDLSFVDFPSVLWYCWLGLLTCKNRFPYNLYCVGGDVKHCSIQSTKLYWPLSHVHTYGLMYRYLGSWFVAVSQCAGDYGCFSCSLIITIASSMHSVFSNVLQCLSYYTIDRTFTLIHVWVAVYGV